MLPLLNFRVGSPPAGWTGATVLRPNSSHPQHREFLAFSSLSWVSPCRTWLGSTRAASHRRPGGCASAAAGARCSVRAKLLSYSDASLRVLLDVAAQGTLVSPCPNSAPYGIPCGGAWGISAIIGRMPAVPPRIVICALMSLFHSRKLAVAWFRPSPLLQPLLWCSERVLRTSPCLQVPVVLRVNRFAPNRSWPSP